MEKGLVIEKEVGRVCFFVKNHLIFSYSDECDTIIMNHFVEKIYKTKCKECFLNLKAEDRIATRGGATARIIAVTESFKQKYSEANEICERAQSNGRVRISRLNLYDDKYSYFSIHVTNNLEKRQTLDISFKDCSSVVYIEFINKMLNYFIYEQTNEMKNDLNESLEQSRQFINEISNKRENKFNIKDCLSLESKISTLEHKVLKKVCVSHSFDSSTDYYEFLAPFSMELNTGDKLLVDTCYGIREANFVCLSEWSDSTPKRVVICKLDK